MFGLPALRRAASWAACLGALCSVSAASADVSLHVFRAKHADAQTISYKLHGLKGRSILSARLRARKGSKTVTKPVKLARKNRMHKAVVGQPASGVIRLGNRAPSTTKVLATAATVTVARPADIAPSQAPVLVVSVSTPEPDPAPAATTPAAPAAPLSACGPVLASVPVGGARPAACWRPYAADSPFNVELPADPNVVDNSAAVVSRFTSTGGPQNLVAGWAGTDSDWARPTYFSSPTDPEYTLHCTKDWGPCTIEGMKVRIPEGAAPAGGGDGHMTIIDQASGWEYGLWQVQRRATGGGQLDFSYGGRTKIDGDGLGDGSLRLNGGNAAGWGSAGGLLRAEELEAGQINHALLITVPCDSDVIAYPAHHTGAACPAGQRGDAPAMGQRFQLTMSDAQIDALSVPAWKKTILRAMAHYGMVVGDTGGSSWALMQESGVEYTSLGQADKWVELAKKYNLHASSGAYAFNIRDGIDWAHNLRVVAPCESNHSCPA